jgi:hypothetical protein
MGRAGVVAVLLMVSMLGVEVGWLEGHMMKVRLGWLVGWACGWVWLVLVGG